MKAEMKDLRKRIEKDRRQLENLEESIVTDSVSCGKKGKKSLGTVKVTGRPDGAIERKKRSLKRNLCTDCRKDECCIPEAPDPVHG